MGKLKFRVHPLFILFGIYFAFTGKVFSFLTYTLCALIHEMGHSISAEKSGYRLVNVTLMPFGAVVKGDISGMGYKDEIRVALAGPAINFCIGVSILALWWLFPETYPYTEIAVTANFALCFINLIPCFPLDGGRVLLCSLSLILKRKTAVFICKLLGTVFALVFFALFILSCFTGVNYSLLFFALFMIFGITEKNSNDRYIRIYESISYQSLKNGKEIMSFAVNEDFTVKRLYRKMDSGRLYRIYVFSYEGEIKKILEPYEVVDLLKTKSPYEKLI
ncbi:MAG: hypothetical protein E7360_03685 [Clostridiales bacterium]|nr:hypothetical protein [Clostridiales bacterium]